jgi:hypothetical protein
MNWYRAGLALLLAFVPFALSLGAAPQTRPASLLDWSPLWPFGLRSVPSESMAPALWPGDRVSVYYLAYAGEKSPKRGDVVIFHHPHNPRVMIKRVIGLSGDTIEMRGGRLILNGREVERKRLREVTYLSDFNQLFQATEYSERQFGSQPRPDRSCAHGRTVSGGWAAPAVEGQLRSQGQRHRFRSRNQRDCTGDCGSIQPAPLSARTGGEDWRRMPCAAHRQAALNLARNEPFLIASRYRAPRLR